MALRLDPFLATSALNGAATAHAPCYYLWINWLQVAFLANFKALPATSRFGRGDILQEKGGGDIQSNESGERKANDYPYRKTVPYFFI